MTRLNDSEADRRLANLVRVGVIHDVIVAKPARARVDLGGGVLTAWLPWLTARAGLDRAWWAPEPGEQVMILSPSGELAQGVILPAIFQDDYDENADSADVHRVTYADGTVVEYDRAAHRLLVDASASNGALVVNAGAGNVTVNCASATVTASESVTLDTPLTRCTQALQVDGPVTANAGVTVSGSVNVSGGDVIADTIGLKTHKHPTAPTGPQSAPVP